VYHVYGPFLILFCFGGVMVFNDEGKVSDKNVKIGLLLAKYEGKVSDKNVLTLPSYLARNKAILTFFYH
jgi:hypothetical protein